MFISSWLCGSHEAVTQLPPLVGGSSLCRSVPFTHTAHGKHRGPRHRVAQGRPGAASGPRAPCWSFLCEGSRFFLRPLGVVLRGIPVLEMVRREKHRAAERVLEGRLLARLPEEGGRTQLCPWVSRFPSGGNPAPGASCLIQTLNAIHVKREMKQIHFIFSEVSK